MIQIQDVRKTYRLGEVDVHALRGVSLTIEQGEFVAIMGPSGSGKSTLMHVLGLLDVPDAGSYKLLGHEVSGLGPDELAALRGRSVGFVFQQFNLLSRTSAFENVLLPRLYVGGPGPRPEDLLRDVGLGDRMHHKPNELSGGQQQRVAIARSLINGPSLLLADEPTGNLDSASEQEILALLNRLNEQGLTVVVVTHEPEIGERAQRVIKMRDGQIISDERLRPIAKKTGAQAKGFPVPKAAGAWHEHLAHFRQAVRSLFSNKVRTGLSMLGILIGVGAVVAMLALGTGARTTVEKQLSSLGSNVLVVFPGAMGQRGGVSLGAGAVTRLTTEDAREISGVSTVVAAAPSVSGNAQVVFGNKNWRSQILGTTPAYAPMRAMVPAAGRLFTDDEVTSRARVAVIGLTPLRELFGTANPIGEFIKLNRVNFQVIGVLPKKGASGWQDQDDVIMIPLGTAMHRLLGKEYVDSISMQVASPDAIPETQESVRALLRRLHRLPPTADDGFQILNLSEIQSALSATSRVMSMLLASIAAISLLVGGIGIMNIMLVSVAERTREIGLRKAVGARERDILFQFLIEAVVISFTGGAAGLLLGAGIAYGFSTFAGWAATVSLSSVILSFSFSVGVGVVFGLWPASKAAKLNPIQALRYE